MPSNLFPPRLVALALALLIGACGSDPLPADDSGDASEPDVVADSVGSSDAEDSVEGDPDALGPDAEDGGPASDADDADGDPATDGDPSDTVREDARTDTTPADADASEPDATTDVAGDAEDVESDAPPALCGDGRADPGELCDGADVADATCADFAFDRGTLGCTDDCRRYVFDDCVRDPDPTCGDGTRDDGEICDGEELGGVTCEGLGFARGEIVCREDCGGFIIAGCDAGPECGDGTIDDGELCDGDALGGVDCADLEFTGGDLACGDDCEGYVTSGCIADSEPECGNGVRESGELCDGADIEASCTSLGFDAGDLGCRPDCAGYVTTRCTRDEAVCGDGTRDAGELCDGDDVVATCEDLGFDSGTLRCAPGCAGYVTSGCFEVAVCGDDTAEGEEVCDGDDLSDQTCRTRGFAGGTLQCALDCSAFVTDACTRPAECGNGLREDGEVCDGDDLARATCVERGYESGDLACAGDCRAFDESGCIAACTPDCGGRACGPDPVCGDSCGTCSSGYRCTETGTCELDGDRGPRILRFNSDVFDLSDGENVTFSAIVTDPDGIDDVIGGTLDDPVTGRSYGAFATGASEGAYSLTLTWTQIHRVRPIDFTEDTARTFEAVFFDVSGSDATVRLDITLTCDGDFACDGVCVTAGTVDNCTACDDVCPDGGLCGGGGCTCGELEGVCDGVCTDLTTTSNCGDCGDACAVGGACVGGLCTCGADAAVCDGVCTDLTTTSDCGDCGNDCAIGAVCDGDACQCPGELDAVCDGACVDLDSDAHCGGCGNSCIDGASCVDRACECPRPDIYCPGVGCVDPSRVNNCGGCGVTCASNETCTASGCERASQGDIRINALGYTDVYFSRAWRPLCEIFRATHAEGACESIGMDVAYSERDVVRSDHIDGAGISPDYFCPAENIATLAECALDYVYCGPGTANGFYSSVHCFASSTPDQDGDGRFDGEGRPQVFFDGRWLTVTWAFGYFDEEEAAVFCRSMGMTFDSMSEAEPTSAGDGYCLGAFDCVGTEASLADCVEYAWAQTDCGLDRQTHVDIVCR